MKRAAIVAAAAIAVLAAFVGFATGGGKPDLPPQRAEAERPPLQLLTSLPLVFAEQFALGPGGSPALEALESRYRVAPISVAQSDSLEPAGLLLMAHSLAQPAEALVELDQWVRSGGRLLLVADPKLDWPSSLPLGHPHRPPLYFADTGLLSHWGLTLDLAEQGRSSRTVDGRDVRVVSPGRLSGACQRVADGFVARCAVGNGRVTIVADADFLMPAEGSQLERGNRAFLLSELERLER